MLPIVLACSPVAYYVPDPTWAPKLPASMTPGKVSALAVSDKLDRVFVGQRGAGAPSILCFTHNGTFERGFGDEIKSVHGMKVHNENLWVTDTKSHTVNKYDAATGKLLLTLGTAGKSGNGTNPVQFGSVADVAFDSSGNLFISDGDGGENNRVMKLAGSHTA